MCKSAAPLMDYNMHSRHPKTVIQDILKLSQHSNGFCISLAYATGYCAFRASQTLH